MDELVKRLRNEAECPDNYPEDSVLMREAADAIEELQKAVLRLEDESGILDELPLYQQPVGWIPVTERLPENDTAVLAHVYWPEYGDTMICYGHWHKGWFHLFHHVEGELISGYVVTHWMPLPQPPKEGTQ